MFSTTATNDDNTNAGTGRRLGRLAAVTAVATLGAVGLAASPAAADQPFAESATLIFQDVNPCTNEPMTVTIQVEGRVHLHDNGNVVAVGSRTGTTSDGYVMERGNENFVFNGNVARGTVHDTFRNDAGSAFTARGFFVEKEDGLVADGFRLRCITP